MCRYGRRALEMAGVAELRCGVVYDQELAELIIVRIVAAHTLQLLVQVKLYLRWPALRETSACHSSARG